MVDDTFAAQILVRAVRIENQENLVIADTGRV